MPIFAEEVRRARVSSCAEGVPRNSGARGQHDDGPIWKLLGAEASGSCDVAVASTGARAQGVAFQTENRVY